LTTNFSELCCDVRKFILEFISQFINKGLFTCYD
jgi:hypothetical protein